MSELDRTNWNDDDPTDVDRWLAIYSQDSSLFWSCSIGHIENVLDELIYRVREAEETVTERIIKLLEDDCSCSSVEECYCTIGWAIELIKGENK